MGNAAGLSVSLGTILNTQDGGNTWQAQSKRQHGRASRRDVHRDGQRGWTVGDDGTILSTRNGGRTWVAPTYARYPAPWFYAAAFLVLGAALYAGWRLGRRKP
jgi:photosystem II stability/assembly factor-like uncharacterized protein